MSTVQILIPENREAWLKLRRNYITATDAVAIRGLVPWASPLTVLQDKLNLRPDSKLNKAMVIGSILEPVIALWYLKSREIKDGEIVTAGEKVWVDGYLAATPDLVWERNGRRTLVEIKTSSEAWQEIPERVAVQVDHQANLVVPDDAFVIDLFLTEEEKDQILVDKAMGKEIALPRDPVVFRHDLNPEAIEKLANEMEAWHLSHILLGEPLPMQIPVPKPEFKGAVEVPALVSEWKAINDDKKLAEQRVEELKKARAEVERKLADYLGQNKIAKGDGIKLSRAFIPTGGGVDHEGILNALVLQDPSLAEKVKAIEEKFITASGGYYRWTPSAVK